jgi:sigma-B regulation protein RsbU (phosphoserine phosphatase)
MVFFWYRDIVPPVFRRQRPYPRVPARRPVPQSEAPLSAGSCQSELDRLQKEKVAFEAQVHLLEQFVGMARAAGEAGMLKAAMQKTLSIAVDLTGACCGSLFLFDEREVVTDSLLARNALSEEERRRLVGTVLDQGLAGWVRRNRRPGVVRDTLEDGRWIRLDNQPYRIRSALAIPILRGEALFGILTLMHPEAGHFDRRSIEVIQMTADQMALALENIQLYQKLDASFHELEKAKASAEAYAAALDRELEKGRRIQKDFLPDAMPSPPGWAVQAFFAPAQQVAGDFYDVFGLPGGRIGWVVGDVCDKGLGAALYMGLFRSLIRLFSGHTEIDAGSGEEGRWGGGAGRGRTGESAFLDPLRAVHLTNAYIVQNHGRSGIFATLVFAVVDPETGRMAYVNAGHEPAYVLGPGCLQAVLRVTGPSVGLGADSRFDVRWHALAPGEMLLGHTDGVTETFSSRKGFFGRGRLQEALAAGAGSPAEVIERIRARLTEFAAEAPPGDDITLLALQRLPDTADPG